MISDQTPKTGLEYLLEELEHRFLSDEAGRLIASVSDGVLPRFVLGRAAEGCVWRFSAALSPTLVRSVAKLAGREKGSGVALVDGKLTAQPERLVMICRLLRNADELPKPRHEKIMHEGRIVGELWTCD